jgi:hypothetical protein
MGNIRFLKVEKLVYPVKTVVSLLKIAKRTCLPQNANCSQNKLRIGSFVPENPEGRTARKEKSPKGFYSDKRVYQKFGYFPEKLRLERNYRMKFVL